MFFYTFHYIYEIAKPLGKCKEIAGLRLISTFRCQYVNRNAGNQVIGQQWISYFSLSSVFLILYSDC